MSTHSRHIEVRAVTAVKEALSNGSLFPYINDADKEPSWDGFVYIKGGNPNYLRIPAQVKGKEVKAIPSRAIYNVKIHTLKNYLHDGGVIYFVVYIIKSERYIYYTTLAPLDISRYIKNAHGKASIAIKLRPLPSDIKELEYEFRDFHTNSKAQISFKDMPTISLSEAIKNGEKISFTYTTDKDRLFLKRPVYLYKDVQIGNTTLHLPIGDQAYNIYLGQEQDIDISINNNIYYNKCIVFAENGNQMFHTTDGLRISLGDKKINIQIEPQNQHLSMILKHLYFWRDLDLYKSIRIGDNTIKLENYRNPNIADILEDITRFEKVKELFTNFGISDDIDFASLSTNRYSGPYPFTFLR